MTELLRVAPPAVILFILLNPVHPVKGCSQGRRFRSIDGFGTTVQASYGFNATAPERSLEQALAQFVQSLRGYWQAYFRLRRVTMFDFETGTAIQ